MDYFRYTSVGSSTFKAPELNLQSTQMVLCIQQRSLSLFGSMDEKNSIWPSATTLEQKLYDQGFIFAGLLEDIDRIIQVKSTIAMVPILLNRCQELDEGLIAWYELLTGVAEPSHAWRLFLAEVQNKSEEHIIFPDLRLAHLLLCFWTLRMLLVLAVASLSKLYSRSNETSSRGATEQDPNSKVVESAYPPPEKSAPQIVSTKYIFITGAQLAELILRAISYCTSDEMGLASCTRSIFGLRATLGFLRFNPQYTERLEKCQALVAQMTEKRGVSFAADIARLSGKWGDTRHAFAK